MTDTKHPQRDGFRPVFDVERIRRVVVGVDQKGRSTVAYDDISPHVHVVSEAIRYTEIWTTPSPPPPDHRHADTADVPETLVPRPGGTLFRICETGPAASGIGTGLHATSTVDYIMVLSGRMTLTLESGETCELAPGDIVVQRGTAHAWSVDGPEPCVFAAVITDAPDHAAVGQNV
jgi:quercetin dioxygenase-like cupin family protein